MAEYEPFVIERAQGCTLGDLDGREYLDGVSSLWCNIHGHHHPRLDEALRRQLDQVEGDPGAQIHGAVRAGNGCRRFGGSKRLPPDSFP